MSHKVSILHPFTPSAVGIPEDRIPLFHSRPHVLAMAKLAQDGYQCSMEYFSDKTVPYTTKGMGIAWRFHPVSMRWTSDHKKWKKQWSFWALWKYWRRTPDVTIINMSGHSSPFSMKLAKLILRRKKKYIAMFGGQHLTLDDSRVQYYRNAGHILVHTRQQRDALLQLEALKECDIRVFPLGVDCERYKPVQGNSKSPNLLFVGRIIEWKRVHLAIEALDALKKNGFPDAALRIVGPISSETYFQELQKIASDKGISESVSFEGFVAYDNLLPYYQEADIFLLPSDHETFGMVMIESMACGTPVAGIDCPGGPKEVIQHGVNGILASPESYAGEILEVFQNRGVLQRMQTAARETAVKAYSIDATYSVLKQSVEDCLS